MNICEEKSLQQKKLFDDNIKLVFKVVSQFPLRYLYEFDDLFQVACVGLLKAVRNNDERKGFKFSSLAFFCMRAELINYSKIISNRRISGENVEDFLKQLFDYRNDDRSNYDEYYSLYDAIYQLNEVPRGIIIDYYFNDKSTIEIGKALNKKPHTIWCTISRTLGKLRQILSHI